MTGISKFQGFNISDVIERKAKGLGGEGYTTNQGDCHDNTQRGHKEGFVH